MANPAGSLSLAYLEAHPRDAARVLERLTPSAAADLLASVPLRLAAPVLRQMLPLFAARAMDRLGDDRAAGLLRAVGPQAGVAVLRQMPRARADTLIGQLPAPLAVAFRLLLGYPENTVGAWTDPHALAVTEDLLGAQAIEHLRTSGHEQDVLYVVDGEQRLVGVVPLVELLRAPADTPLRRLMQPPPITVPAQSLISALHEHSGWTSARALVVVERGERFAGVLWQTALTAAHGPAREHDQPSTPGDVLSMLAGGYWGAVAGLIEMLVSWLPVKLATAAQAQTQTQTQAETASSDER